MERSKKHSTVSNVPYSLSDIQLPDSPGKCIVKPPSKSISSDMKTSSHSKKYKSRFDVPNKKSDPSDDCETPSNGVSSTQCLNLIDNCQVKTEKQNTESNTQKEFEDSVNSNTSEEHKTSKLEVPSDPEVKENIVNVALFEGEEQPVNSVNNDDGEQSINLNIAKDSEEKNSTASKPDVIQEVKCIEEKMEVEEQGADSDNSEAENHSHSDDHADNLQSRGHVVRKRNKSESSDSTTQSSESSSEMDVYAKHGEDLKTSFHKSSETKESLALVSNVPETKETEEKTSLLLKSIQPRRLKIKRNNIVSCDNKNIEPEVLEKDTKQEMESPVDSLEVPEVQKENISEELLKPVEPAQIKISNRKLSLSSRKLNRKSVTENDKQEEICLKKSRWGNYASSLPKSSISISTDSLKNLIPDFKLITGPVSANDVDDTLNPIFTHDSSPIKELIPPVLNVAKEMIPEDTRIETSKAMLKQLPSFDEYKTKQFVEDSSLPQGPASRILFIKNLVRPFTLLQLKDLLKQTGNMIEEHFWIDKIKSKCFVEYETEEEAVNTRQALNATKWPSSNPKILSVEFATQEELDLHRRGNEVPLILPPLPPSNIAEISRETRTVLPAAEDCKKKERDRRKEKSKLRPPVREWDKDKIVQDSPERESESKEIEKAKSLEKKEKKESKNRPNEDTPAKLLDDLFQKTKSSPCIYWLPLTDEQVKQKKSKEEEEKRQRILEREKRNQLREQEEAERRNRRARPAQKSREKENRRSQNRSRSPANRRR